MLNVRTSVQFLMPQFAFGMSHLVLNTLAEGLGIERDEVIKLLQINESEIRTINYEESGDYK